MSKQPWALVLGASSGFGEATAVELARAGMNIFGVHLDHRNKQPHIAEIEEKIRATGHESQFFNANASDDEMRADVINQVYRRLTDQPGVVRVLLHSLAWGTHKPLAGAEQVISKTQLEITADTMGHSLVYWVQDCLRAGLLDRGTRIFAMTSAGGTRALPNYGPVSAAKAILESHIRQLAVELAPAGITANAILAGVADTPALRQIPDWEKIAAAARQRNPHGRLTTPDDVARAITALCHPATYWMTGNVIHVDGGESIVG